MDVLLRNYDYIESVKTDIKEGDYLVIMRILQDYYLRLTGALPYICDDKLCISEDCDAERYEDGLCDKCYYGWHSDDNAWHSDSDSDEDYP